MVLGASKSAFQLSKPTGQALAFLASSFGPYGKGWTLDSLAV